MKRTLLAAATLALTTSGASAQEVTLTLHHFLGPKSPAQTEMLEPWVERIEEQSDGRIAIEIYPAMSLGGAPPQLFRQVADGVVDIAWIVNGYNAGLFPRSEVFELPTVFNGDITATNLAMREMFEEYLAPEYEPVHLLFNHVHGGQALHTRNTEVRSPQDTAGMKLRVPGPTGNTVVSALGATPVTMPVPDAPQAFSTGAIDGALIPWEIIPALQLYEVTDYQIEGPDNQRLGTTTFQVSMNKERWESLPDDLKQVFMENTGEDWLREIGEVWRVEEEKGLQLAVDSGNTHIVLSEEEWGAFEAAMEPVVEQWIADHPDFDARALVDKAREAIARHSGDS